MTRSIFSISAVVGTKSSRTISVHLYRLTLIKRRAWSREDDRSLIRPLESLDGPKWPILWLSLNALTPLETYMGWSKTSIGLTTSRFHLRMCKSPHLCKNMLMASFVHSFSSILKFNGLKSLRRFAISGKYALFTIDVTTYDVQGPTISLVEN